MQEELENRVVVMIETGTKLSAHVLKTALTALLAAEKQTRSRMTAAKSNTQHQLRKEPRHGKTSLKALTKQGKSLQTIEVSDQTIGSFNRVARKYGVDFAPYKIKGENKYLVFFKAPDRDSIAAAFEEYTAKESRAANRMTIRKRLEKIRDEMKSPVHTKVRRKELER